MKTAWRAQAAFVTVSVFAVIGCDSTQPDRIESRNAVLSFETRAVVDLWDCYETPFPACFEALGDDGIPREEDRPVPWPYDVKITIIRAGTVEEVVATSVTGVVGSSVQPGDSVNDFISLGNYDLLDGFAPSRVVGGILYSDGHLVSTGSPIYLSTNSVFPGDTNLLEVLLPATPEALPTFEFTLNTGDTVVVRARKQSVGEGPPISPRINNAKITGFLALSGILVPVLGTQQSPDTDSAGITFSFTVQ